MCIRDRLIVVFNCLVTVGFIPLLIHPEHVWKLRNTIATTLIGLAFGPPCFLGVILIIVSLVAYNANVIQFGWDQLRALPKDNAILYIHWYVWSSFFGQIVLKVLYANLEQTDFSQTFFLIMLAYTVPFFMIVLAVTLCLGYCKPKLFAVDNQRTNPYAVISNVIKYALQNKIRLQDSDESDESPPSRFDIGKEKFGGPFQNRTVEDVKAFLAIGCILLTLGPTLATEFAASELLPHFGHHMDNEATSTFIMSAITPLVVLVAIPMYTCLLRPCIKSQTPSTLKRIGLGMMFFLSSIVCCFMIDSLGHANSHSTACFLGYDHPLPPYYTEQYHCSDHSITNETNATAVLPPCQTPLGIPLPALFVPYILNGLAYLLFYIAAFEFIWTQSPDSMKGFAVGIFFATKGIFQLVGVLVIYAPFTAWSSYTSHYFPSCGFVYYLINTTIAVTGIVIFMWRARLYQYRDTDQLLVDNIQDETDHPLTEEQPA